MDPYKPTNDREIKPEECVSQIGKQHNRNQEKERHERRQQQTGHPVRLFQFDTKYEGS